MSYNAPDNAAPPKRLLIFAIGNPLRGDDGVAWRVAETLGADPQPDVNVIGCHQLVPEHADTVSLADWVAFIDATVGPGEPGEVQHGWVETADPPAILLDPFSHHIDPPALLALASQVYGSVPHAEVFTVRGVDFGVTPDLSPLVEAALPKLIALVRERIVAARCQEAMGHA